MEPFSVFVHFEVLYYAEASSPPAYRQPCKLESSMPSCHINIYSNAAQLQNFQAQAQKSPSSTVLQVDSLLKLKKEHIVPASFYKKLLTSIAFVSSSG
jgi:hypothetical protein